MHRIFEDILDLTPKQVVVCLGATAFVVGTGGVPVILAPLCTALGNGGLAVATVTAAQMSTMIVGTTVAGASVKEVRGNIAQRKAERAEARSSPSRSPSPSSSASSSFSASSFQPPPVRPRQSSRSNNNGESRNQDEEINEKIQPEPLD
ncbi:hypothetical protein OIO90_006178 [Microbotryomycetes sp. JL221]|nr:hypothetical protein OIO90_006178 [Microbotryomycetes sp. JL221]